VADDGNTIRDTSRDTRRAGQAGRDAGRETRDATREGTKARRGPRPSLTTQQVVRAGMDIADAEGLGAVSMGRIAAALGVSTMALYRYVSGKDELLTLMLDLALGDVEEATTQDAARDEPAASGTPHWRRSLERWARRQLGLARRRPWVMQLTRNGSALGPNRATFIERGLAALADTPLTWAERTEVIGRLSLHLLSEGSLLAAMELQPRAAAVGASADDAAQHPALVDYDTLLRRLIDPVRHPNLTEALDSGAFESPTEVEPGYDPDFGLRLFLDGVAALVTRAEARSAG